MMVELQLQCNVI